MQPTTTGERASPAGSLASQATVRALELDRQALVRLHLWVQCEIWRLHCSDAGAAEATCLEQLLGRLTARIEQVVADGRACRPDLDQAAARPAPEPALV